MQICITCVFFKKHKSTYVTPEAGPTLRNVRFQGEVWSSHLPIQQSRPRDAAATLRRHKHDRPEGSDVSSHHHGDCDGRVHVGTCAESGA